MTSTSNQPGVKNTITPGPVADAWFTPGRFAFLLAALIVVCFPRVVFGLETFFYRDFGAFAYPLAFYHREAFWHGEMPLWNPYSLCGLPFLAQWNTLTLYPLSLFYLIFPLTWSLGVFNLAHMFCAGLGMYFLAHRWTNNRFAASLAGLVYAFNGLTWNALMWPNNIAALGWMPWVVLGVERAWLEGGARNLILAALTGAMQMLTGAPEVIILTWFALGVLWLTEWTSLLFKTSHSRQRKEADLGNASPPQPPYVGGYKQQSESPRWRMLWRFLFVVGLVFGLTAAQLVPFLDLLLHSQRNIDFADSTWAMPLSGWVNYVVPLFHCIPGPLGVRFQQTQFWTPSYYPGVGIVALALMALWRVRDRRMWVLAGLAAFSLLMALGDSGRVYTVARKVFPVMGFMRFPIKFVVLTTFAVPLLAAYAISWWERLPEAQWRAERKRLWLLGWFLLGGMASMVWWEWLIHRPHATNPTLTTKNAFERAFFLVLILGCLAFFRRLEKAALQRLASICLLLLFWFDVFTHSPNESPTIPPTVFEPGLIRQYFKWDNQLKLGESRAMPEWFSGSKITIQTRDNPVEDLFGRRLGLYSNYNLLDHVPKFDGFFSMDMREIDELNRIVAPTTTHDDMPRLKDFLGISHFNNPTNPVDWVSRDTYLPMITAGQQPVFLEDEAALQAVVGARFDPVRFVYLPPDSKRSVTATNPAEARVLSQHVEAQRIDAEVQAAAPAMVVVAQAYYHPWHAYVDGKRTPLYRANYAFQALEVPAGKHEVKLVYEDWLFDVGAVVSLTTLLLVCLGWFWLGHRPLKSNE